MHKDGLNILFAVTCVLILAGKGWGDTILFDLGTAANQSDDTDAPLFAHWNNVTDHLSGVQVSGAVDATGRVTTVNYNAVSKWNPASTGGVITAGLYGQNAQEDYFLLGSAVTSATIDIEGLPTDESYIFTFFGSRDSSGPREIDITIGGVTQTLEAAGNVNTTVSFPGVSPNLSNKVRIDCQISAGSFFGYSSVIEISGSFPSAPQLGPNTTAYYISPDGSDLNAGTLAAPFRTLEWAQGICRLQKQTFGLPAGGITVFLRGGRYFRAQTFTLTSEDSGTADKPVIYRAYPGEEVRLIGGLELDPAWFSLVNAGSPVWSRLDAAAQGNLMQVDLGANGITDYGIIADNTGGGGANPPMELNFNGDMMQLGRWPNSGFESIASAPNGVYGLQFGYSGTRPERWGLAEDPRAFAYWFWNWWDDYLRMTNINTGTKVIMVAPSTAYGIRSGQRWYALNLLEEIDTPGEWYLNRNSGILYFWPPSDINSGVTLVSTLRTPMVRMQDASYIALRDLIFEVGRDGGISISGGSNNLVSKCTMRSLVYGAALTGTDNGVDSCEVYDVKFGLTMNGGDRNTLTPANLFITNNHIHDWSRWDRTYAPAVSVFGCGNRIAHNLMHDAPHLAISYSGNDHVMEFNEIHHVVQDSSDSGAIYAGRNWGYQGIMIRHNFIHNIINTLSSDIHAIYLDDMLSGQTVFGNVFYNIAGIGILNNGGRDNISDNNVFARCRWANYATRRGVAFINCTPGEVWYNNFLGTLLAFNYQSPPWSDAYPLLVPIPNDCSLPAFENFKNPEGCEIVRSIGYQNAEFLHEGLAGGAGAFSYHTIADNIENQNPLFVDESTLNLALQDNSPAYTIPGFQEIPFAKIGPLDQGDLNQNGEVNFADYAEMALAWQTPGGCSLQDNWCDGADLDWSGQVDLNDLKIFACCSWLIQDDTGPPAPEPNQNPDTIFIEDWDYTTGPPLTSVSPWTLGHFDDTAVVVSGDPLVGSYLVEGGGGIDDSVYLLQTDYVNALLQGPIIRFEMTVMTGGVNDHVYVGFGDFTGGWSLALQAFNIGAFGRNGGEIWVHDGTGLPTKHHPAGYAATTWYDFRADIDPAANGGNGELDLYWKMTGQATWVPIAALSNLNLQLLSSPVPDPFTQWTGMFSRVSRTGAGLTQEGRLGPFSITSVTP